MSLFGKAENEKTVLLNSHMDVVPVNQVKFALAINLFLKKLCLRNSGNVIYLKVNAMKTEIFMVEECKI